MSKWKAPLSLAMIVLFLSQLFIDLLSVLLSLDLRKQPMKLKSNFIDTSLKEISRTLAVGCFLCFKNFDKELLAILESEGMLSLTGNSAGVTTDATSVVNHKTIVQLSLLKYLFIL